jgi:hypothetical protein
VLVALLAATGPVRAATLTFADVMQAAGANGQLHPASEVRLRVNTQSGAAQSGSAASQQTTAGTQTAQQQTTQTPSTTQSTPDGTLSQSGGNVQTVDLGDVTGTVCDCGEIPAVFKPKGGIPWWPFTGIVLICATGICHGNECTDCNIPVCTDCNTTTTPEPATLLLFGSGLLALGAAARRRYDRKQLEQEMRAATEEAQLS